MSPRRRFLRKTERPGVAPLEEQFWPVILAVFAFAAFLMGSVLAYLPLHGSPWYRAASTWLFAIPLAACVGIWVLRHVPARTVRRSLQLSLVLCLLAHAALLAVSMRARVFGQAVIPNKALSAVPVSLPPRVFVPEYTDIQLAHQDQRKKKLLQSVTVSSASPRNADVAPPEAHRQPVAEKMQPLPEAETKISPDLHEVPRAVPMDTVPRQGERPSLSSRQPAAARPREDASVKPSAQADDPQKSGAELAPRTLDPKAPSTSPVLAKGPQSDRMDRSAELDVHAAEIARSNPRERDRVEQPDPAKTDSPRVASRQPRMARREDTPGDSAAPPVAARMADPAPASNLAPAPALPRRQQSAESPRQDSALRLADNPSVAGPTVSPTPSRRTPAAPVPTLKPDDAAAARPSRTAAANPIAASPKNVESPTAGRTSEGATPDRAEPGQWSLARSTAGAAGLGTSANLDRAAPAAESPALEASGAARRKEATQETPPGAALAPSQISRARRSVATGPTPGASFRVNTPDGATHAADESLENLSARSSASVSRSDSNARSSELTAALGAIDVDTGPTRIVREEGRGRGSGGGQPLINPRTDSPAEAQRRPGGQPRMAIATEVAGAAPAAPSGSGGGQPLTAPASDLSRSSAPSGSAAMPESPAAEHEHIGGLAAGGDARLRSDAGTGGGEGLPQVPASPLAGTGRSRPGAAEPQIDTEAREALSPSDAVGAGMAREESANPVTADVGRLSQESNSALSADRAAEIGPGGMGDRVESHVGLDDRRALPDNPQISSRNSRFVRPEFGGPAESNSAPSIAAEPFRKRMLRTAGDGPVPASSQAPGPQTEEAIEKGLDFLARYQQPNGSWSLQTFRDDATIVSDTAATGLALLAFQGAGYTHRDHRYASQQASAMQYLIDNQKADGDLYLPQDDPSNRSAWLYSHSIAALAMCEAYGMTQDDNLRQPAQLAVDFIAKSQDPVYGGWRYNPGSGADTSVTGWMMMALKSGELSGLKVPSRTYERARRWLDSAQQSQEQPHLYRYNPFAPDTAAQRHGRNPTPTMTAVGLLVRLYDGWRRDRESMAQGARYLLENPPALGTAKQPKRDTYYWYYGTQVMFHMGGEYWDTWNRHLHPLLIDSQIQEGTLAGSWNPRGTIPDRWGTQAGRIYVTTMNLLSLEVYYRHLPLYENTAR
jgi:hypothetical protein